MQYEAAVAVIEALCDADRNAPERAQVTIAQMEELAEELVLELSPCGICQREFPEYEMELVSEDWVCQDCIRRLAPLYEE